MPTKKTERLRGELKAELKNMEVQLDNLRHDANGLWFSAAAWKYAFDRIPTAHQYALSSLDYDESEPAPQGYAEVVRKAKISSPLSNILKDIQDALEGLVDRQVRLSKLRDKYLESLEEEKKILEEKKKQEEKKKEKEKQSSKEDKKRRKNVHKNNGT